MRRELYAERDESHVQSVFLMGLALYYVISLRFCDLFSQTKQIRLSNCLKFIIIH